MNTDFFRALCEGACAGGGLLTVIGGLYADRFILRRLNKIYVTKAELEERDKVQAEKDKLAAELAKRDAEIYTKSFDQLSQCIRDLAEEQKNLGRVLARLEGKLEG